MIRARWRAPSCEPRRRRPSGTADHCPRRLPVPTAWPPCTCGRPSLATCWSCGPAMHRPGSMRCRQEAKRGGVVRDPSGPLAGAMVEVVASRQGDLDSNALRAIPRRAVTLDDGTFSVEGLEPDTWYQATAKADWHAVATGGGRPSETAVDLEM